LEKKMKTLMTRRALLQGSSLFLFSSALGQSEREAGASALAADKPAVKIGLITDIHYADTPTRGTRFYREGIDKLTEAVDRMNQDRVDFAVELGDFIDADAKPTAASELKYLKRIDAEFSRLKADRHYVLGNHCVYSLTKQQFLDGIERPKSYYSFDKGPFHFVVLDACYRKDGMDYGNRNYKWTDTDIPALEREWLEADLKATRQRTVVFVHQRLDLSPEKDYAVKSSPEVRRILETSGKVIAVLQGHNHMNDRKRIQGIPYVTFQAMVEQSGPDHSAYSVLNVFPDGSLQLSGFRRHQEHPLVKTNSL
jgi:hypothetical protein